MKEVSLGDLQIQTDKLLVAHLVYLTALSLSESRMGEGRVHPRTSPQFIAGPWYRTQGSKVPRQCSEGVRAPSPTTKT